MLTLDRKAFIDILTEGEGKIGGAMLPPPEGLWGMPPDMLRTVPGYGPDVEEEPRPRRARSCRSWAMGRTRSSTLKVVDAQRRRPFAIPR